jgi:hypothetical protein
MSSLETNSSLPATNEVSYRNEEGKKGDVTKGENGQTSPHEGAGAVIAAACDFIDKPLESADARLAMNARIKKCLGEKGIRFDHMDTLHFLQKALWMMSEPGAERHQQSPSIYLRGSGLTLSRDTQVSLPYTSNLPMSSNETM